jgi:hypothetical protein
MRTIYAVSAMLIATLAVAIVAGSASAALPLGETDGSYYRADKVYDAGTGELCAGSDCSFDSGWSGWQFRYGLGSTDYRNCEARFEGTVGGDGTLTITDFEARGGVTGAGCLDVQPVGLPWTGSFCAFYGGGEEFPMHAFQIADLALDHSWWGDIEGSPWGWLYGWQVWNNWDGDGLTGNGLSFPGSPYLPFGEQLGTTSEPRTFWHSGTFLTPEFTMYPTGSEYDPAGPSEAAPCNWPELEA